MAILHVKSPNGTTHTVNLTNMNFEQSAQDTWGYWIFPNWYKVALMYGQCYIWGTGATNGEVYFPPPITMSSPPYVIVATTDANSAYDWRHRVEYIGLSANQLGFYVSAQQDNYEGDSITQCFTYICIGPVQF